ncbi:MAG: hypothetical protein GX206_08620 [Clostridiales bacterium]|nr:hypothetical protein [Clostridiales bacterium]
MKNCGYKVEYKTINENEWTKISHTFTIPAGTKSILVMLRTNVKDKNLVRFDAVRFEEGTVTKALKSDATQKPSLTYDLSINKNAGSMGLWFYSKVTGKSRYLITNEGNSSQLFALAAGSNNKLSMHVKNTSGTWVKIFESTEVVNANQWNHVVMTWETKSGTLYCNLYLNNKLLNTSGSIVCSNFGDFTGAKTTIGSQTSGQYPVNGLIENFVYSPKVLSASDISKLYSSGRGTSKNIVYDSIGRITKTILNVGSFKYITEYTYHSGTNGSTTALIKDIKNNGSTISYTYDANGNIETISEGGVRKVKYYYNELNELIREDNKYIGKTIVYKYDAGGNILSKIEYSYTEAATPTNSTRTYSYSYGDANWKDKLTAYDGKAITYDAIGNPLTYNGYKYTWQNGRQLAGISGNGLTISYKYNDSGIRTEKTVNGVTTKYTIVDGKVTFETNGTDKIYYTYDASGNLVSMNLNGVEYYYVRNAQGDIIQLLNQSGAVIASYTYDSWGKLISIKDGSGNDVTNNSSHTGYKNPYRYRGYRYDSETGFYSLQSRYYDPEIGRFINADDPEILFEEQDSLLQYNLFAYCWNNPVNMDDQTGESPANIIGGIVGGATGAALGLLLAKQLGLTGWKKWALVSAATVGGAALGAFIGPYVAKLTKAAGSATKTAVKTTSNVGKSLCFVAGTLVETQDGHIPIENVKAGDYVYAENPETGEKWIYVNIVDTKTQIFMQFFLKHLQTVEESYNRYCYESFFCCTRILYIQI